VPLGLPFGAVGFLLSMSFGVLAVRTGFSPLQAVVMSAVVHAGSAQFAALSIAGAGGRALPPRAAAVIALLPAALLAALVVTATLTEGQRFHVDASAAGARRRVRSTGSIHCGRWTTPPSPCWRCWPWPR